MQTLAPPILAEDDSSKRGLGRGCELALYADVAPASIEALLLLLFERSLKAGRSIKLFRLCHTAQPETVDVGKVVARPLWALTLHKGLGTKISQAAS